LATTELSKSEALAVNGSMKSWVWDRIGDMDRNQQLGEVWTEALAAERGIADNTFEAYGDHLDCYFRFLDARGVPLDQVDVQVVADYLQTFLCCESIPDANPSLVLGGLHHHDGRI
jgi:Phage integrase, N-terminal SAM-like domain